MAGNAPKLGKSPRESITQLINRMSEHDRNFVNEYLKSFDPVTAAVNIGYEPLEAEKKAYELVSKKNIDRVIKIYLQKRREFAKQYDFSTVLPQVINIAQDANASPSERLKAAQLIAQYNQSASEDLERAEKLTAYEQAIQKAAKKAWQHYEEEKYGESDLDED